MRPVFSPRARITALACAALFPSLAVSSARAQGFEGAITFRFTNDDGKTTETLQTTKGRKVRIEGTETAGADGGAWIVDPERDRVLVVSPSKQTVMVMTRADMQQMQAMSEAFMAGHARGKKGADDSDYKLDFKPTGETRTVAGERCKVWRGFTLFNGTRREGEACIAEGVGFAMFDLMADNPMVSDRQGSRMAQEFARYRKIVGPNKGILQTTEIKDGKAVVRLEATKIERKRVSDALFEPPPGYKVQSMGQLFQAHVRRMQQHQQQPENH